MLYAFSVFIHICMLTGRPEGVTLVEFEPIEGEIPHEEPKEDKPRTFQSALTTVLPPFRKASPEAF
jgi:hypothetical protein